MCKRKYTFKRAKRPKTKSDIMAQRFRHAKASLAIEGLSLTPDEIEAFEECIRRGYNFGERQAFLQARFPGYDKATY